MALYKLIHNYLVEGQQCTNRYFYNTASADSSAEDLFFLFQSLVIPFKNAITHQDVEDGTITVENMDDMTDWFTDHVVSTGFVGGECLPPFFTSTFTLIPTRRDIRKGRKAFSGVSELMIETGGKIAAPFVNNFLDMANALKASLTTTPGAIFPNVTYDPALYRKGTGLLPTILTPLAGAAFRWFSTQSSRKIGRGS